MQARSLTYRMIGVACQRMEGKPAASMLKSVLGTFTLQFLNEELTQNGFFDSSHYRLQSVKQMNENKTTVENGQQGGRE